MKFYTKLLRLVSMVACMSVLYSCEKEKLDDLVTENKLHKEQSLAAKADDIDAIRSAFLNTPYESKLYAPFSDTLKLYWEPLWHESSRKVINDSTTYYYIPLHSSLRGIETGSFYSEIEMAGIKKLLLAKRTSTKTEFSLATYFLSAPAQPNASSNKPFSFDSFSGDVRVESFTEGGVYGYTYKNGKREIKKNSPGAGGASSDKSSGDISASGYVYECTQETVCIWSTSCTGSSQGAYIFGTTTKNAGYGCLYPTVRCASYSDTQLSGWQIISTEVQEICTPVYYPDEPTQPDPYVPPGGGGGGTSGPPPVEEAFNPADVYLFQGQKPLAEYANNCSGAQGMWNTSVSQRKEVVGVLTKDGKVMTVAITGYSGGSFGGLYHYQGNAYYTYPVSYGAPTQTYTGMIESAGSYIIPIIATIHTHVPCLDDNTDGVSNKSLSEGDKNLATEFPMIPHYIIGCNAVGMFRSGYTSPTLKQSGPLSTTCTNIK